MVGMNLKCIPFSDTPVDHGKAVSFLVSSQHALGLTDGSVVIGDDTKRFN